MMMKKKKIFFPFLTLNFIYIFSLVMNQNYTNILQVREKTERSMPMFGGSRRLESSSEYSLEISEEKRPRSRLTASKYT